MKTIILFLSLLITFQFTHAQKRGAVWCFGDSALVDFSDILNISTGHSTVKSRGTCVSISDTSGQLVLYAFTRAGVNGNSASVINNQDLQIQFGDSIVGEGWYHELVIIPNSGNDSSYVLFSVGVTGSSEMGFFYSIIDMSANGGLGEVIQKNVQLENFTAVDCLSAIKHGNGRDWWVIVRKSDYPSGSNNDFYLYLVSPAGIINQPIQSIGSQNSTNSGRLSFNSSGNRMCFINYKGLIELNDFDRCTGTISNPVTISPESLSSPWPALWSAEFSPSSERLYVSRIAENAADSSRLYQFDLNASNISASKIKIWETSFVTTIAQLKKAPNNKIFIATNFGQVYPYTDSMYNSINMNLSVINAPDSLGIACDLQPFSFYLGGKRSYAGLPNNPDYDLGPLAGSLCDSLTSISEPIKNSEASIYIYYAPGWDKAFINADKLKGHHYRLRVLDIVGKEVYSENGNLNSPYFTRDLNCASFASGIYLLIFETEKERLVRKFEVVGIK
ncbi:MAG: T9SS type A sorting domain-containing protein [Bacteroidota bacterium]|nr:T9SS type A sorting domain-containing protein [Bacteroidota bacterium]